VKVGVNIKDTNLLAQILEEADSAKNIQSI